MSRFQAVARPHARGPRTIVLAALAAATILTTAVAVGLNGHEYVLSGDTDPGRFTAVVVSLLRLAADASGAICLGALIFAGLCTVPGGGAPGSSSGRRVGPEGYAAVLIAGRAAVVWAIAALLSVPASAADSAGRPLSSLLDPQVFPALFHAAEPPKGWLVAAVLAVVVAALTRVVMSWTAALATAVVAAASLLPPALAGNAAQGAVHDVDTNAIILHIVAASAYLGLAFALLAHVWRGSALDPAVRRYTLLTAWCWIVVAVSGVAVAVILVPGNALASTAYGRLVLGSAAALAVAGAVAWWARRRMRSAAQDGRRGLVILFAAVDVFALLLGVGSAVAMAHQPAPQFYAHPPDASQVLIGYDLPRAPDLARLLTLWRPDFALGGAAVVLAAAYLWGVWRLRSAGGEGWSAARAASWTAGCVVLLVATCSGLNTYAHATFSAHMTVHMLLLMVAPLLLVLGSPFTLARRVLAPAPAGAPPSTLDVLDAFAHSRFVAALTNPVVAVALYTASLFGLYFTGLYEQISRYHWEHQLTSLVLVTIGYCFYWAVLGDDEGPRRLPHLVRLGMLLVLMPINAVFGVALLTTDQVVGYTFYHYLSLSWMTSLPADQHLGAVIGWIGGEVPMIAAAIVLALQWRASDGNRGRGQSVDDEYQALIDQLVRERR